MPGQKKNPVVSVVVPCFNEEASLPELYRRLKKVLQTTRKSHEMILVNDGSRDSTWQHMESLARRDSSVVAIDLSRNFGHQIALSAGLKLARGQYVLILDADLQDPPELLPEMIELMKRESADVVYGQRRSREGESKFKLLTATFFYRLLRRMTDVDIPLDTGDFRLMSRRALRIINDMPEHHRFIRGMVGWIGFHQIPVLYDRKERFAGATKYPFKRMLKFALDAITGFSTVPLRLAVYSGLIAGLVAVALMIYVLGSWMSGHVVQGWTSLTMIVLWISSLQLLISGVMGEYLGRLYLESKRRPLFIIKGALRHGKHSDLQ
ncbi:MAG: glycosyltransferase family 2 protein [Spirochaetales bacterium]|nr:glycosyltransferase family 2 protein [Spirochaetales bacterium]